MRLNTRRAVLYTSASVEDRDGARQKSLLISLAAEKGYEVTACFHDVFGSRSERKKTNDLAKQQLIDIVLVTDLLHWANSIVDLVSSLQELQYNDVSIETSAGQDFDLTDNKVLDTMKQLEEFERAVMGQRTKLGMLAGKKPGPKKTAVATNQRIRSEVKKLLGRNLSVRGIAEKLSISPTTVQKIKNEVTQRTKIVLPARTSGLL